MIYKHRKVCNKHRKVCKYWRNIIINLTGGYEGDRIGTFHNPVQQLVKHAYKDTWVTEQELKWTPCNKQYLDKQVAQVYRPEQATVHHDRQIGNQTDYSKIIQELRSGNNLIHCRIVVVQELEINRRNHNKYTTEYKSYGNNHINA